MKYQQRDVLMISMQLPDGTTAVHPYLIISCAAANSKEDYYSGVMMTTSSHRDKFSMELDDSMFENPVRKTGNQLRLYIISSFREKWVQSFNNRMKKAHFKAVVEQVKEYVFSID